MKKTLIFGLMGVAATLQGCGAAQTKSPLALADESLGSGTAVVAVVNGRPITEAALKNLKVETAMYNKRIKVPREKLIQELVDRELIYQEALKHQFDQLPAVADQINVAKRTIVSKAYMRALVDQTSVSREELRAEYAKRKAQADFRQFRIRHILVNDEQTARRIVAKLQQGGSFEQLAREFSQDKTGAQGGELGWRGARQMSPEMAKAVKTLQPGDFTHQPVKTSYGWHVVQLEDVREQDPPSFAQVEHSLASLLKRKKLKAHLEALKQKSTVEIIESGHRVAEVSDDKLAAAKGTR